MTAKSGLECQFVLAGLLNNISGRNADHAREVLDKSMKNHSKEGHALWTVVKCLKHIRGTLIVGTSSSCGKTTVVCAILQALNNRKYDIASYKCGAGYIDPIFNSEIISAPSTNIDLFFTEEDCAGSLFENYASELNVIEGVAWRWIRRKCWHCTRLARWMLRKS